MTRAPTQDEIKLAVALLWENGARLTRTAPTIGSRRSATANETYWHEGMLIVPVAFGLVRASEFMQGLFRPGMKALVIFERLRLMNYDPA